MSLLLASLWLSSLLTLVVGDLFYRASPNTAPVTSQIVSNKSNPIIWELKNLYHLPGSFIQNCSYLGQIMDPVTFHILWSNPVLKEIPSGENKTNPPTKPWKRSFCQGAKINLWVANGCQSLSSYLPWKLALNFFCFMFLLCFYIYLKCQLADPTFDLLEKDLEFSLGGLCLCFYRLVS